MFIEHRFFTAAVWLVVNHDGGVFPIVNCEFDGTKFCQKTRRGKATSGTAQEKEILIII